MHKNQSRARADFLERLFTRQERKALAFLLGMGFFGIAVMACQRGCAPASAKPAWVEVRVNRADAVELAALPGIGPVLAERIVKDRQRRGFYLTLADLGRVKGVSPKVLKRMERMVRFD